MSRSSPTLTNPAAHFFKWSGSKGKLVWWNKEKQTEVEVRLPFEFLVLDQLNTITGYSDQDGSGFWSNETRSIKDDLNIRTKKGTKYFGPYKNEQGIVQVPQGARYTKSIYIAHKIDGNWVIGNIKASGAALTAWIDLGKKNVLDNGKVRITGATEAKKGATVYQIPVFEWDHSSTDEDEAAIALDKDLQIYLSQYLSVSEHQKIQDEFNQVPEDTEPVLATQDERDEYEALQSGLRADEAFDANDLNDIFPE